MEKFIFAFVLILSPGLSQATTILVMGDSISTAHGFKQDHGWVTLLQQKLNRENRSIRLINASISGETTAGGLARIEEELERHPAQIVIIELGGNDGLRGLSPKAMQTNLAAMIERSRNAGAKVILLGMRLPPNYGKRYAELFAGVYYQLEKQYDIPLVPFLLEGIGTNLDLMQHDGIHPNARAQFLIMEMVLAKLRPMLEPLGGCPRID